MLKEYAKLGPEAAVRSVLPGFKRIEFQADSDYPGARWLWANIEELNAAVQGVYHQEGYRGGNNWLTRYASFYPKPNGAEHLFHWVIVTAFGEKVPFCGEMIHCPFPNAQPSAGLERYQLREGDKVLVPKNWALGVLGFARSRTTEIGCGAKGEFATANSVYWKKQFDKENLIPISENRVDELAYHTQSAH